MNVNHIVLLLMTRMLLIGCKDIQTSNLDTLGDNDEGVYIDISMDGEESVEKEVEYCADDTECDRGYRCSPATQECTKIPDCLPNSGRQHGLKHGECIPCSSDDECGWFPGAGLDFCWPDGGCRDVPPFRIFSTRVVTTNGTVSMSNQHIESTGNVNEGDRTCLSVVPTFREDLFHVDIIQLDLCASTLYFKGRNSPVIPGTDKSQDATISFNDVRDYENKKRILYPGIIPYNPDNPGTTGCRTDPDRVRVHTVLREGPTHDVGNNEQFTKDMVDGRHHFHPSILSSVTMGKDTVCFSAKAITAPDVPIYIEATIDVTPDTSVHHASMSGDKQKRDVLSEDEVEGLYRVYGLTVDDPSLPMEWKGIVSSPRRYAPAPTTISLTNGFAPSLATTGSGSPITSEDSMYVSCPGGTKFDGVAGICEQPAVSKDLFFWLLIASTIVLIIGSVLFIVRLKSHNEYMMHLIRTGQIIHIKDHN
jgi:hypothetical protein